MKAQRADQLAVDIDAVTIGVRQVVELIVHGTGRIERHELRAPVGLVSEFINRVRQFLWRDTPVFDAIQDVDQCPNEIRCGRNLVLSCGTHYLKIPKTWGEVKRYIKPDQIACRRYRRR